MLIKAITGFNQGVESIDTHILIDNVSQISVTDWWSSGVSENDESGGIQPDGIDPDIIQIDREKKAGVRYSHQHICIAFVRDGRHRTLISQLPVFVMNDSGKTVQTYNPVHKSL